MDLADPVVLELQREEVVEVHHLVEEEEVDHQDQVEVEVVDLPFQEEVVEEGDHPFLEGEEEEVVIPLPLVAEGVVEVLLLQVL